MFVTVFLVIDVLADNNKCLLTSFSNSRLDTSTDEQVGVV